jgi:hypothetical protein
MRQVSISEYNSTWISNETETTINRLLADNKAPRDLVDYLIKENKRLREALKEIAHFNLYGDYSNAYKIPEIARAALKEGE